MNCLDPALIDHNIGVTLVTLYEIKKIDTDYFLEGWNISITTTHDLFAYGSLMCPDIMAAVSTLAREGHQAVLPGYRRLLVRGEQYPAVIPAPDTSQTGVVYHDITAEGWARLDRLKASCMNGCR